MKFHLEYPNNILVAISVNATDISSVPVAFHFVNVYFFGRLFNYFIRFQDSLSPLKLIYT